MQFNTRQLLILTSVLALAIIVCVKFLGFQGRSNSDAVVSKAIVVADGIIEDTYFVQLNYVNRNRFLIKIERELTLIRDGEKIKKYQLYTTAPLEPNRPEKILDISVASSFEGEKVTRNNLPYSLISKFQGTVGDYSACRQLWEHVNRPFDFIGADSELNEIEFRLDKEDGQK